jgi:hypothetical protein
VTGSLYHLQYPFAGRSEYALCCGPEAAECRVLIIPPLFDEMNRMRRVLVSAMRALSAFGVASVLPDLPGCNESEAALRDQNLNAWQGAVISASAHFAITHVFSVRGGCLIDDIPLLPKLRLAPVKGKSVLNLLIRSRISGDNEGGLKTTSEQLAAEARMGFADLAGNHINASLWHQLGTAIPVQHPFCDECTVTDIDGSAIWLRAEPQDDPAMAAGIARRLENWCKA